MAKVTKIKASDSPKKEDKSDAPTITRKKVVVKDKKTEKIKRKKQKQTEKKLASSEKKQTSEKKPFVLFRPFVYLGRYVRDSWSELRQVRWPNRKATWKMVLAIVIYSAFFMILITLLDLLFTWLFSLILGNN